MSDSESNTHAPCDACGHPHSGAELGFICVGCPCEETPGRPAAEVVIKASCGCTHVVSGDAQVGDVIYCQANHGMRLAHVEEVVDAR